MRQLTSSLPHGRSRKCLIHHFLHTDLHFTSKHNLALLPPLHMTIGNNFLVSPLHIFLSFRPICQSMMLSYFCFLLFLFSSALLLIICSVSRLPLLLRVVKSIPSTGSLSFLFHVWLLVQLALVLLFFWLILSKPLHFFYFYTVFIILFWCHLTSPFHD